MSLFVCWVLFPLLLGLIGLGCGLLLESVAGVRLPGPLLPPVGLALVVVVAQFATLTDAVAELATPAVIALAAMGLMFAPPWRRGALDRGALACALGVFAAFAAPVVLSGHPTLAGYIKLDDTATWLAMTDRVMDHGRSLAGLAPSTYEATLDSYLTAAYPIGAFLPFGIGRALVGQDSAWVFQPYLAFLAAMMALSLYVVVGRVIRSSTLRVLVVFITSQAALLFGYSLWGGIKELSAAWIIALIAALVRPAVAAESRGLRLLPLAVATAAGLAILSFGGLVWLAPALVAALIVALRTNGRVTAIAQAAAFTGFAALLSLPALLKASEFLKPAVGGVLTSQDELGNLVKPLSWLQFFGIWPVGDFRFDPSSLGVTYFLIVVLVIAAAVGLAWAARRRAWEVLVYVATATIGCAVICAAGAPWVDAKALATASPAFLLAGLVGAAAVFERGLRIEAVAVAATIAGGVLWSNALAFHEVNLAPHDRFAELEKIGHLIAGEGPTLTTEYEPYSGRHFLRDADPEGASELRRRQVLLRKGGYLQKLEVADIDAFQLSSVLVYRTLVLRRSPTASRPPSAYRLIWSGRFYEVWQRPEGTGAEIREHLSLGDTLNPAARPACRQVLRLARAAGKGGRLAAVARPNPTVVELARASHPPRWPGDPNNPGVLSPTSPGTVEASASVPVAGRYGVWLGGSFRGRMSLSVDGNKVWTARDELSHAGEWIPMGTVELSSGPHVLELRYDEGVLHPGSGGQAPSPIGPLALATNTINRPITYVRAADARMLCGTRLDWVEALRF